MHGKRGRRLGDCLKQHVGVELHHQRVFVDVKPGFAVSLSGLYIQHLNAFIAQQIERGQVNCLKLIFAELRNRRIRVFDSKPRITRLERRA